MKLSEAMRLGSMALPPTTPGMCDVFGGDYGDPCSACALGAIGYAIGVKTGVEVSNALFGEGPLVDRWPLLGKGPFVAEGVERPNLACAINRLFESCFWTREQIADWVETIEQQQEAIQPLPAEVMVAL